MTRLAVLDDHVFDDHHDAHAHPECPERLTAAREGLRHGLGSTVPLAVETREPSHAELTRVHAASYLSQLERSLQGHQGHLDADTFFSRGTRSAAWAAAGGVVSMTNLIWRGDADCGLALVRPPGHHAEPDRAMGFCLLNNVAIAAADLLQQGATRVAIVDWDVHHGNGTQHAFYEDPRVLFVSLHQWPLYPGTGAAREVGAGAGTGFNVNVPLPAQSGPEAYASAFRRVVLPVLAAFSPEVILVSAGFDAHARDPLASMQLDAASYRAMASALLQITPRVAWILEGGYDLQALSASVQAVTEAALGRFEVLPEGLPAANGREAIDAVVRSLQPHWPGLR